MTDLKLFDYNETIRFGADGTQLDRLASASISSTESGRLETIVNKVVKFMMTEYGSDPFDTEYGSRWSTTMQLSRDFAPQYIVMVTNDLDRCIAYIKNAEKTLASSIEKLYTVQFNGLEFNNVDESISSEVLISLTIYTNLGNKAIFSLSR